MDIFGTTVTVMTEVYNITIFIRGIISDIKAYDSTKREIRDKLEHEFIFLSYFKELFFEKEALMRDHCLHDNLKRDVRIILVALRKTLTEYGLLAAKHGLLGVGNTPSPDKASEILSFSESLKSKLKDLKTTVDWALFDKDRILKMLADYSEWTGRLRQTMSLVLLTLSAFGNPTIRDFKNSARSKEMGLEAVINRQALVSRQPSNEFRALCGRIIAQSELIYGPNIRLAKYEDEWYRTEDVMLEYRKYNKELVRAVHFKLPELDTLKEPIRDLAWLLHTAFFAQNAEPADSNNPLAIYTLRCLGYLDQPEQGRTVFVYQLPKGGHFQTSPRIMTLHDWISNNGDQAVKQDKPKPSLGNRFFLAHALCLTLLNIHSSGWVHKNIWSHGIVVFPCAQLSPDSNLPRFVPYVVGWGFSRPITGGTELNADPEVESNFYRHPVRQGYPQVKFNVEHDIYALGVVLLEIGLWETVSSIFKNQLDKATAQRRLPPPEMIREDMIEKARSCLPREMGDLYARSVERCLSGEFGVHDENEDKAVLSAAFRETVMDAIAGGMKL
jgi:hypothetical protein